jgi:outer membrane protein TolC
MKTKNLRTNCKTPAPGKNALFSHFTAPLPGPTQSSMSPAVGFGLLCSPGKLAQNHHFCQGLEFCNWLLIFFFACFFSSCTKSIPQIVEERYQFAQSDYQWFYDRLGDVQAIELNVDDAINFALENSLELRIEEAELKVVSDDIRREMILMLPNLEITALEARRNNLFSSTSELVKPQTLLPPSFSSLKTTRLWDINCAWDILNTGIQYFRVKEAKNATWAKFFIYQRSIQDLIRDVVANYWLVAIMQQSSQQVDELTIISRDLEKKLRSKVDEGFISLEQATELIGRIYYQQVQAKLFLVNYRGAIDEFKLLLGIPPCVKVILKVPREKMIPDPLPPPCELHMLALTHRPDLYQIDAELALHEEEVKAAILEIFPALTIFFDNTYDSNPFLIHNYWATFGFKVLYNLLSIPLSLNDQMTAEDQVRVSQAQRFFLSLSVLAQIHVAYAHYEDALDRFKDAKIYWEAKKNSYNLALAKKHLNAIGDLEYVFPLSDLAYAETQMNLFYVEMMSYLEQISNTIGIPRYFTEKYEAHYPEPGMGCNTPERGMGL